MAPNIWATAPIIFLNKSTGYESVYMLFTAFGITPTKTYFVESNFTNCYTNFFFHFKFYNSPSSIYSPNAASGDISEPSISITFLIISSASSAFNISLSCTLGENFKSRAIKANNFLAEYSRLLKSNYSFNLPSAKYFLKSKLSIYFYF